MNNNTNLAEIINNKTAEIIDINGKNNITFEAWTKTPDAQEAYRLYVAKADKLKALKAFGSICAGCNMQDLTTCMCMAGHLQRCQGIPVTSCEDYDEKK